MLTCCDLFFDYFPTFILIFGGVGPKGPNDSSKGPPAFQISAPLHVFASLTCNQNLATQLSTQTCPLSHLRARFHQPTGAFEVCLGICCYAQGSLREMLARNFPPACPMFSVATPAEPRGEKKLFFVQILGGEKLLKFVEKVPVKNF